MERKQTEGYVVSTNEDQGIVEAVWAVMGNIDEGGDILHPGAFTKTFAERGPSIALLDNHQTDSIMRSLGQVMALRELGHDELPPALLAKCPEATGAAWGQFKFLLDTPEGKGAFIRLKSGAVGQWSFGYDALDKDFSKVLKDGQEITARNLRTCKLYEISPALFGMNPATTTLAAKAAPGSEAKPWDVFKEGDKWRVYKLDADGQPTGDPLGEHDTEEEARAQMRALYASESGAGKADVAAGAYLMPGDSIEDFCIDSKSGRVIARRNADRISKIREILAELEKEAGLSDEEEGKGGAPIGAAPTDSSSQSEAGPVTPPTDVDLVSLTNEIEELELTLLEV